MTTAAPPPAGADHRPVDQPATGRPLTARDVLLPTDEPAEAHAAANGPAATGAYDATDAALASSGVFVALRAALHDASAAGVTAARGELVRQVDEALGVPVAAQILAGWRTYGEMKEAALATVAASSTTKLVDLASTTITGEHTWTVTVALAGVTRLDIDLVLELEFTLLAAVAAVRAGRVSAIGDGRCDVRVRLTAMGKQVAERAQQIDLHDHLSFHPGIDLLSPAERAAAAKPSAQPSADASVEPATAPSG